MDQANRGRFKPGVSGNPKGRPRRQPAQRRDGWINSASGHGTARDRRTLTRYGVDIVTDLEALQLWRSEPFAARIIEQNPAKALSRGWSISGADKELAEEICAQAEALKLAKTFVRAWQMENALGGAAVFPVLSGSLGELWQPLDEGAIASVDALHVFEPQELTPNTYVTDIRSENFGEPETWRLMPLTSGRGGYQAPTIIHSSRLVVFPGLRVSRQTQPGQREGFGDSCLCRPKGILDDFGLAWGSAATLVHSHGEGVLELDGLETMLQQADGLDEFDRYISAIEMAKSSLRMMVVPGGSKFTRMTGTLAGLSETLNEFKSLMAAAANRPVSVLFGIGDTGLRTGSDDLRAWYATVESERTDRLHLFERLVRFLMLATAGPSSGKEPDVWSVAFPPLSSPTEKEIAETRKMDMDRAVAAVSAGIASADDVTESFYGGDTYSGDIRINWERRRAQAELIAKPDELDDEDLGAMGRASDGESEPSDEELAELEAEDGEDEKWDVEGADAAGSRGGDAELGGREDENDWEVREDRTAARGGAAGGYNPNRAKDGKFAPGARKRKPKAEKFNAAPFEKRIAALKKQEAKHRQASIKVRDQMRAVREKARTGTPRQKAAAKARFEKLQAKRGELRSKAAAAKAERQAVTKERVQARREHTAKQRSEARGVVPPGATSSSGHPARAAAQHKPFDENARPMGDQEFAQVKASHLRAMSNEQTAAGFMYSGGDYVRINSALRGGEPLTGDVKRAVDGLDSAMKLPEAKLQRDTVLYRGLSGADAKARFSSVRPGDVISDKAFMSTAANADSKVRNEEIVFTIRARAGTPGLAIPSKFSSEREILLDRNTRLRVVSNELKPAVPTSYRHESAISHEVLPDKSVRVVTEYKSLVSKTTRRFEDVVPPIREVVVEVE